MNNNDKTLQPCVPGATIAEERGYLNVIRQLAFDIDQNTTVAPNVRAVDFAFQYVREDRTKRQANIRRSKEQRKLREASCEKK